jgi:HAD superfamily hydrolase (TIGR01509 family)
MSISKFLQKIFSNNNQNKSSSQIEVNSEQEAIEVISDLPKTIPSQLSNAETIEEITNEEQRVIKAVVFDFDGVLSSFEDRFAWPLMNAVLYIKPDIPRKKLIEISLKILRKFTALEDGISTLGMLKLIFIGGKELGMTSFQAAKLVLAVIITYAKYRKNIIPKKGVRKVLQRLLDKKYKIILITNSSRKIIKEAIKKIPEIQKFDLIITRDDVEAIKPNSDGFLKALKYLDLKPEECISIGDQASDIIVSQAVGMRTIAITGGYMKELKEHLHSHRPDFIMTDIQELPELLKLLRNCIIDDILTTIDLTEKTIAEYFDKPQSKSYYQIS